MFQKIQTFHKQKWWELEEELIVFTRDLYYEMRFLLELPNVMEERERVQYIVIPTYTRVVLYSNYCSTVFPLVLFKKRPQLVLLKNCTLISQ